MQLTYTYHIMKWTKERTGHADITIRNALKRGELVAATTVDGFLLFPEWTIKADGTYHINHDTRAWEELHYLSECYTLSGLNRKIGSRSYVHTQTLLKQRKIDTLKVDRYVLVHKSALDVLPKADTQRDRKRGEKTHYEDSRWTLEVRISKRGYDCLEKLRQRVIAGIDVTPIQANSAVVLTGLKTAQHGIDADVLSAWHESYGDIHKKNFVRVSFQKRHIDRLEAIRTAHDLNQAQTSDLGIHLAGLTDSHVSGMIDEK